MAIKDYIDVKKARKEATKKAEFLLKELNKNLSGINEGSAPGEGEQQQPTGSYERGADVISELSCKDFPLSAAKNH
ncbi:hypothetical protein [Serratia fonticola]|uniref:Uncharacterized protein n=1 Tax=Serratia fonticola TaxID=47917 RepID=A0ABY9PQI4_SERFO|nr:hypothetical protein [Serratia fonticola]WMT14925.1 hypothetical protein RFB13_00785 [Serratia fonticola]